MQASKFTDARKAFIIKQGEDGVPFGVETTTSYGHTARSAANRFSTF